MVAASAMSQETTAVARRAPMAVAPTRYDILFLDRHGAPLGGAPRDLTIEDLEAVMLARAQLAHGASRVILRLAGEDGAPVFAYLTRADDLPPGIGGDGARELGPEAMALLLPASDLDATLAQMLRESFGLTTAEARLAVLLAHGLTLAEAAERVGVSIHTVRNQLRAVFDKLGLNRQSELVRALTQLAQLAMNAFSWTPASSGLRTQRLRPA